jgi:hypothetical protein
MSYADVVGKVFNPGDNSFTVGCWVKSVNNANNPYLAKWDSTDATANRSWLLWNRSGQGHRLSISSLGVVEETTLTIANPGPTNWQLVIAGYDAVAEEIFMSLDGAAKVTTAHTGGAFATAAVNLTLGWFQGVSKTMGNQDQEETAYWAGRVLSNADCATIWASSAGLRMTEWDATVPEADGSAILTSLVSYFNGFEASGQDRVDLKGGGNTMSEAGAGAPIDQGVGLPAIAKTTASVDFSSNPTGVEFLEKTSPVGMGGGTDSFTIAGFFEFDHNHGDIQGLMGRWVEPTNQRQFILFVNPQPDAFLRLTLNSDGTGPGNVGVQALEDFTLQNNLGSQTRFVVGWYDGDADTTNIQLSNGIVVSAAGPSTIFDSSVPFQVGVVDIGTDEPLIGQAAFWGYWRRVLNQLERTFLFNFFGGQTFAALVAADTSGGDGAVVAAGYNYYYRTRVR